MTISNSETIQCPLCHIQKSNKTQIDFRKWKHLSNQKVYWHCSNCDLVFMDHQDYISNDLEMRRYQQHNNNRLDIGYINFMQPTVDWIAANVSQSKKILDFGSGPTPVMQTLLQEKGYVVEAYDKYFNPDWPRTKFDFVLLHEVFEHLQQPQEEFTRILECLGSVAEVLIRIEIRPSTQEQFESWWYVRDATHVIFPSENTFLWMAQFFRLDYFRIKSNLFLFRQN